MKYFLKKVVDKLDTYMLICMCLTKGEEMEKRDLNISFQKAGNGKNARLIVPIPWLRELGITEESRQVELIFDKENNQLILKKK